MIDTTILNVVRENCNQIQQVPNIKYNNKVTYFPQCILSFKYSDASKLYEIDIKCTWKNECLNPVPHHLNSLS
jgi:hypothetical protein